RARTTRPNLAARASSRAVGGARPATRPETRQVQAAVAAPAAESEADCSPSIGSYARLILSDCMARHVVLLRGVNLVKRNRISMSELRAALEAAGFGEPPTYAQSGNIVLSSPRSPDQVATDVDALDQGRFVFDIATAVRAHAELV